MSNPTTITSQGQAVLDLTNCDKEPIHIPGHVQSCGVLVAANPESLIIEQISDNCAQFFQLQSDNVLGKPLAVLLSEQVAANVAEVAPGLDEGNALLIETAPVNGKGPFNLVAHNYLGSLILEFEPAPEGVPAITDFHKIIRSAITRLKGTSNLAEFAQMVSAEMHRVSGFDRVMVYQFQEDQSGKVIAETMKPGLQQEAFLGLRYPATDIPAQARRLFLENIVRVIPEVNYTPARLIPEQNPRTGAALDMTHSFLRGVSPIHVEYLHNMGVHASMSLAVERNGELWGLIACHHYSPRTVDYTTRSACEYLAHSVSLQLTSKEDLEHADYRQRIDQILADLLQSMAAEGDVRKGLSTGATSIADLLKADGVVLLGPAGRVTSGEFPDEITIQAIIAWLEDGPLKENNVYSTANLSEASGGLLDTSGKFSGVLALSLGRHGLILWFRKEQVQTVTWAGNPEKPVEQSADGLRLSPRKSFEAWTETVQHQSLPWLDVEIAAVKRLELTIKEVILRKIEELEKLNEELQKSNVELDSFAYIASHDLKEPLRGIHNYSEFLKEDYGHLLDDTGMKRLNSVGNLSQRMENLLDSLLYYSRAGRVEMAMGTVDLNAVLDDVMALLNFAIEEKNAVIKVPRPLPKVYADSVRINEVFYNLISNALKYSDKEGPIIEIGWVEERDGTPGPVFYVKDNGIGIHPRNFEAIFRIFKRLHARDSYGGGTGAGLAITKKIIERHKGKIWVESEAGKGAVFYFTLANEVGKESLP